MNRKKTFEPGDIDALRPAEKVGLVATVNSEGLPHVTLITSLMATGPDTMTLGQFCIGRSKWHMQNHPKVAFLILSQDRRMWRGRAMWTHKRTEGPEYEAYNEMPMFRYNSYFGINTVHYLDLVGATGPAGLPLARIIPASLLTRIARAGAGMRDDQRILKPYAEGLFNNLGSLKFLSYVGDDGFPVIIPVIQCQAAGSRRLVFSSLAYRKELQAVPEGKTVAVFCLTLTMESVLIRGSFTGLNRHRLVETGRVDIEWVYNSMMPCHDQIYPEVALEPVIDF